MSFIQENWEILTGIASTTIGSIVAFFSGQKKKALQTKNEEANVLKTTQSLYDDLVKDMKLKYEDLNAEMKDIKQENREQRKTLRELQKDNSSLHKSISALTKENHELKQLCKELKEDNEKLRKKLREYENQPK